MNLRIQSLPPGWQIEALGPSRERRDCCIRIVNPEGREITYVHKPFQFACDLTRQLASELRASQRVDHVRPHREPGYVDAAPHLIDGHMPEGLSDTEVPAPR